MKYFKVILNSDLVPLMTLSSVIIVICPPQRLYEYYLQNNFSCQELKEGRKETGTFMAGKSGCHAMKVGVSRQKTQRA